VIFFGSVSRRKERACFWEPAVLRKNRNFQGHRFNEQGKSALTGGGGGVLGLENPVSEGDLSFLASPRGAPGRSGGGRGRIRGAYQKGGCVRGSTGRRCPLWGCPRGRVHNERGESEVLNRGRRQGEMGVLGRYEGKRPRAHRNNHVPTGWGHPTGKRSP